MRNQQKKWSKFERKLVRKFSRTGGQREEKRMNETDFFNKKRELLLNSNN